MAGPEFNRRALLRGGSAGLIGAAAGAEAVAQASAAPMPLQRGFNVLAFGADPTGVRSSSEAIQRAIDMISPTGGTVYIPAGEYRITGTLSWVNPQNAKRPGILFQGDGPHSPVLRGEVSSGPVLRVRGVPTAGPVATTFFWGGGIKDLTIRGNARNAAEHGLEVLGWYYGEITNTHFQGLGGDGIRAVTDPRIDPNPDFTSSTLFVRGAYFERIGGFGFHDASDAQGAPAWSWDRCIFMYCRAGGAIIRSGGHGFTKCSFAMSGWAWDTGPAASRSYGLCFDGAVTANAQHMVEGCEFDNNLTAHVGIRFLSASSFLNNRFIFNDRRNSGRIRPATGVEIGIGDANACILGVQFRQSFFRADMGGDIVGFDFVNTANVRDVEIAGSVFTAPPEAHVQRYRGQNPGGKGRDFGLVVRDGSAGNAGLLPLTPGSRS